jgi:hypothetical protein
MRFCAATNSECLVMAMIGARIAALGLALAVSWPSPEACAFRLRLGPFLLGVRTHHPHYHRHAVRRPTEAHRHPVRKPTEALHPKATPTDDVAQNRAPILLYPILAWPSLAAGVFRPTNYSPWPFSYQSIFDQALPNIRPIVSLTCADFVAKVVGDICER